MGKPALRTSSRAFREASRRLGEALRALRAERRWTQRFAADRCGIGVAVLRRLEQGRGNPSLALLLSLAREYDVEIVRLLGSLKISSSGLRGQTLRRGSNRDLEDSSSP